MIERLVAKAIISFILGQLEKFKASLDWGKIQADLDKHVRDLVPGTWFDDAAVKFVDSIFGSIRSILEQGDHIKSLLELLAAKKYDEALAALKYLLLGQIGHLVAFEASDEKGPAVSFRQLLA